MDAEARFSGVVGTFPGHHVISTVNSSRFSMFHAPLTEIVDKKFKKLVMIPECAVTCLVVLVVQSW